jgi:putative membrane protein
MSETADIPLRPKDLGELRTVLAADRTLMAWIRTSLSMFSFGFTIYKILQSMAEAGTIARSESPRQAGLFLAGLGTIAILLGTISYWLTLRDLQRSGEFRLGRPVLLMATIMSLVGVALFIGILNHAV